MSGMPKRVLIEMDDGEVIEGYPINMNVTMERPTTSYLIDGSSQVSMEAGRSQERISLEILVSRRIGRGTDPDWQAEERRRALDRNGRRPTGRRIAMAPADDPRLNVERVEPKAPPGEKKPEEKPDALLERFLNMDLNKETP